MSQLLLNSEKTKQINKTQSTKSQNSFLHFSSQIKKNLVSKGFSVGQITNDQYCLFTVRAIQKLELLREYQFVIACHFLRNNRIITKVNIIKNGVHYTLKYKSKNSMVREFLNSMMGSGNTFGQVCLNPLTNQLSGSYSHQLSAEFVQRLKAGRLFNHMVTLIQKMVFQMKIVFYKVLYLIGEVDQIFYSHVDQSCNLIEGCKKLNQELNNLVQNLLYRKRDNQRMIFRKQIQEYQNQDTKPKRVDKTGYYAIMDNLYTNKNKLKDYTQNDQIEESYYKTKGSSTVSSTQSSMRSHQLRADANQKKELSKKLQQYQGLLKQYPYPRIPNQKVGIFTEIVFKEEDGRESIQWEEVIVTPGTILSKGYGRFRFVAAKGADQNLEKLENLEYVGKYLIKKQFHGKNAEKKYEQEARVLRYLADKSSINIAKFYYVNSTKYQNAILMDLYSQSSADIYMRDNDMTMSLKTKMALLTPISQGLRLLRDCNVVHMDLKFQNVLVGKGLLLRITDFGQSIILDKKLKKNTAVVSGYTLPYTPHQQFSTEKVIQNVSPSRDTYSFGVMLDVLLMNRHILPFRRTTQASLMSHLEARTYPQILSFVPQKYLNALPHQTASLIWTMVLLCMHPLPQKRPNMDVVTIVLKMVQKYIDEICT